MRHILPREMSVVKSKAATRSLRRSGGGGFGPLESTLNAQRRRASLVAMAAPQFNLNSDGADAGAVKREVPRGGKMDTKKSDMEWTGMGLSGASVASVVGGGLGVGMDLERELSLLTDCIGESIP